MGTFRFSLDSSYSPTTQNIVVFEASFREVLVPARREFVDFMANDPRTVPKTKLRDGRPR
jgi:hypothetical protein